MTTPPTERCADVNLFRGHVCGLPLGHPGAHIQDLGNLVVAWGYKPTTSTEVTP